MHDCLDGMFAFTKQGSNERSVSVFATVTVCGIHGSALFCIFLVIATTTFPHHKST